MVRSALAIVSVVACSGPEASPPTTAPPVPVVEPPSLDAAIDAPAVAAAEVWLRGSTHVHAKPSGDSTTPIPEVIAWYESRGYDFIVLTDHNKVSEVADTPTRGPAVRAPSTGTIVLAGIELTHNPTGCVPPGDASGNCRIHVNLLGVTARPAGKLDWTGPARKTNDRVAKYRVALDQQTSLGGISQLNHPQYYWGMTPDVLLDIARRGLALVEIANVQFETWNAGDKDHPSTEALWDAALGAGVTLWGVASDDAHHYDGAGKYPAGGGWVMVKARRDPQAIVDALAAGRFYASTGVMLERAEVVGGELVVEVSANDPGSHSIDFVENGKVVAHVRARTARRAVPQNGYVRALVTRGDGKKAWVQPARR